MDLCFKNTKNFDQPRQTTADPSNSTALFRRCFFHRKKPENNVLPPCASGQAHTSCFSLCLSQLGKVFFVFLETVEFIKNLVGSYSKSNYFF